MSGFLKNTAVTGFPFHLVSATDGSDITSGTVTVYYTLDGGTQTSLGTGAVHEGNGEWSITLTAASMNGDVVGITCVHTSAITAHFTIKTDTKIVSDLNDIAATSIVSSGAITTSSGAVSTVTTLTNLPAITANWITAAGINAGALDGKGDWNIGKTGYSLSQTFPTNFADLAITASTGLVTVGTNNDKTGYSISGTKTTLDALNDITTAQVNTEVDNALDVTTYGEPAQGAPGATVSLGDKISYIYKFAINEKHANATTIEFYNSAGSVVDHKSTISDDGTTYTEGAIVSGP